MKTTSARSWKAFLWVGLVIAVVVASGCVETMHGGGVLSLFFVTTGSGPGVATDANVAVSVTCNDRKDAVLSTFHWTDNANGANFTAHLPWTPLSAFPVPPTCEEAAAVVSDLGFSTTVGLINSQGQPAGSAAIAVSVPGAVFECGALQEVHIQASGPELPGGSYEAAGCLDRGKIVFQNP
jgi:hypothetical protein